MARRSDPRRRIAAGGMRRRLTVAFILVAGLSAGALAAGSFLLVRQARLRDSLQRAQQEARSDVVQAEGLQLSNDNSRTGLLQAYANRGVATILVAGQQRYPSNPRIDPPIPGSLQRLVVTGHLAYQRVSYRGQPLLLIGSLAPASNTQVYFAFPEQALRSDLNTLGSVLAIGWLMILVVAGLIGRALARRTLEPVARASAAARSLAEGLLATRLPVEAKDEFGAWAASFNEMADALEAKVTELSEAEARERRFTSDVAHELRTPLTALVGEASLLRQHLDRMPGDARRPAELLIHDVGRLRRLVDELMEISRLDSGRDSLAMEGVDLTLLAAATIRSRGWEGRVDLKGQRVPLSTDRRRVERVIANLVDNALEHAGGAVRVRVGKDGSRAFVEVSDDGPGIPLVHLPHVFERFYKADPARTSPGSGLGLAISLENARLLGGAIDVWSEPGRGSRFTLWLPVTEPLRAGEEAVTGGSQDEVRHRPEGEPS